MKISKNNPVAKFITNFPQTYLKTQTQRGWFVAIIAVALMCLFISFFAPLLVVFAVLFMIPVAIVVGIGYLVGKWIEKGESEW